MWPRGWWLPRSSNVWQKGHSLKLRPKQWVQFSHMEMCLTAMSPPLHEISKTYFVFAAAGHWRNHTCQIWTRCRVQLGQKDTCNLCCFKEEFCLYWRFYWLIYGAFIYLIDMSFRTLVYEFNKVPPGKTWAYRRCSLWIICISLFTTFLWNSLKSLIF